MLEWEQQTDFVTVRGLTWAMLLDTLRVTGITVAMGTDTNLYLVKIATDVRAKHVPADKNDVHIVEPDGMSYRRMLWDHRPLTDFWRMSRGYAAKLEVHRLCTMGDIVRCSIGRPTDYHNEKLLYKLSRINAEILIDHAWGWELCITADVKAYRPEHESIISGQMLQCPYNFDKVRLVVQEVVDTLALELMDKDLMITNRCRRRTPKHAMGTGSFPPYTPPASDLQQAAAELYDRVVDRNLLARRLGIGANKLLGEGGNAEEAQDGAAGSVHRLCRKGGAKAGGLGRPHSGAKASGDHTGRQGALRRKRHPQTVESGGEDRRQGA